jgi:glycosyltransferase involved in cell wall biosynthesis
VKDQIDPNRVHFVGFVDYARFVSLLQLSRAHAYLSYPFVLSWSMIEAMSAGALVIGSNTPPVAEVIKHGENGLLVDFFDVEAWSNTIIDALARPEHYAGLRVAARETAIKGYDLNSVCLPAMISFLEGVSD